MMVFNNHEDRVDILIRFGRLFVAEHEYLTTTRTAATTLAENYVGLTMEPASDILVPEEERAMHGAS